MVGLTRYLEMSNELLYNDNNGGGFYQLYQPDQIRNWVSKNATDPDNYPITDWNSLILKKSAPRTTHTVTVNGGNDVVRSSVSLAYDQVNALYDGRKFQRYMLRANNDFTIIKDRLYATLDVNIRRAKNDRPVYEPFDELRKIPAIYPAVWENGAYADGKSGANPYALIHESGTNTAWSTQIGGKASLELRPVKGLSIQAIISPFINYTKTREVYVAYRKAGYSKKFLEAHREEITLHKAAKEAFDKQGLKKLPKVKDLNTEYAEVLDQKKKLYPEYRRARDEMRQLLTVKANVDRMLSTETMEAGKEKERDQHLR